MIGGNSAGLKSKLKSLEFILSDLQVSLWFIQETKYTNNMRIKFEGSEKYDIFQLNRKNKSGSGLAIGATKECKPVLIREEDNEIESLVIEIEVQGLKVRCVNGYGPQNYDTSGRKDKFWKFLYNEVREAFQNEIVLIIQIDGNLWAGNKVIKGDPHEQNSNGKYFEEFLSENSHLTLVNSLDICDGKITRERTTTKSKEQSILDFVIVCDKVRPFVEKMRIDEQKEYALTRYNSKK